MKYLNYLPILICSALVLSACSMNLETSGLKAAIDMDQSLSVTNGKLFLGSYYLKTDRVQLKVSAESFTHFRLSVGKDCLESAPSNALPPSKDIEIALDAQKSLQHFAIQLFESDASQSQCFVKSFVYDDAPPVNTSVSVLSDLVHLSRDYVGSAILNVSTSALDVSPVEVLLSTSSNCSVGTWQPLSLSQIFNSSLTQNSEVQVFAKFRDFLGNETPCTASNKVHVDIEAPKTEQDSIAVSGIAWADPVTVYSSPLNLSLHAEDDLLSEMKISDNQTCQGGVFESFRPIVAKTIAGNTSFSVLFKDRFGRVSQCRFLNIVLEAGGPSATFSIAAPIPSVFEGKKYVQTSNLTLELVHTNATGVTFFSDSSCNTPFSPAPTFTWGTSPLTIPIDLVSSDGEKVIALKVHNAGGLTSSCLAETVVLSQQGPQNPDIFPWEDFYRGELATKVYYTKDISSATLQAAAVGVGLKDIIFKSGTDCSGGKEDFNLNDVLGVSSLLPNTPQAYSVEIFDAFDRGSGCYTAYLTRDTVPGDQPEFFQSSLDIKLHRGSLVETPRFFLKNLTEIAVGGLVEQQTLSQSGFSHFQGRLVEVNSNSEILPWTTFPNLQSLILSKDVANEEQGVFRVPNLNLVKDLDYKFEFRSFDKVGNASVVGEANFKAQDLVYTSLPDTTTCDPGYLFIPEDREHGTNGFCVAQFEMKKVDDGGGGFRAESTHGGKLYDVGGRVEAEAACQKIGKSLISNQQWNAIARNVARVDDNWEIIGGKKIRLNTGWAYGDSSWADELLDSNNACEKSSATMCTPGGPWIMEKRTHKLSTGEFIWDLSGNLWEIVSDQYTGPALAGISNSAMPRLPLTNYFRYISGMYDVTCEDVNSAHLCGFGYGWISSAKPGQGISRGGRAGGDEDAGIFTIDFDNSSSAAGLNNHGFRCVYNP